MLQVLNQENLRKQLQIAVTDIGLKAKNISEKTGILYCDVSRFKNGKIDLCIADFDKLKAYLDTFSSFF